MALPRMRRVWFTHEAIMPTSHPLRSVDVSATADSAAAPGRRS
ncbi:hypothetical protein I547_0190 [Mycobacterium kansasii 824]|nr:hypothetical protein I547_0190 [Mycobacterium kansasii 824]